jgi:arylsulfatase A-like enzyme
MRILVLNATSCHVGYLGCYGNDWIATPNLDRLAAEGVVFDRHLADRVDAEPGLTARAGRLFPSATDVALESLVTWTRGAGIPACRSSGVARQAGMPAPRGVTWLDGPSLAPPWRLDEDLLSAYTEDQGHEPLAEPPTVVSSDDLVRVQDTYAAAVTWFDAEVGRLLETLEENDELEETLLVFTASSGFPLGEHGHIGGVSLYEESVHLPLIVRFPAAAQAGMRIGALTQPVDLFPTLLGWLGTIAPASQGFDLGSLIREETEAVRPFAVSMLGEANSQANQPTAALRSLDWALLPGENGRQLFVKPDDRWEVNDVAPRMPELADTLEGTVAAFLAKLDSIPLSYPEPPR